MCFAWINTLHCYYIKTRTVLRDQTPNLRHGKKKKIHDQKSVRLLKYIAPPHIGINSFINLQPTLFQYKLYV